MAETLQLPEHPTKDTRSTSPAPPDTVYRRLVTVSTEEAEAHALQTLLRELRLEGDDQRRAIHARFRSWATLSPEEGARIASAYDRAHDRLTPEQQIALDEIEQEVVRHGLSYREFEHLSRFVPWLHAWYVPQPKPRRVSGPPAPYGMALALGA